MLHLLSEPVLIAIYGDLIKLLRENDTISAEIIKHIKEVDAVYKDKTGHNLSEYSFSELLKLGIDATLQSIKSNEIMK